MGGLENVPAMISPRGMNTIIIQAVFTFLALTFLSLRLYTNFRIRRLVTVSDWLAVAAFLFYLPLAVCVVLACVYGGLGFHVKNLDPAYGRNNFKITLLGETAYPTSLALTKCSICYLLATIFPVKPFRIACLVLAVCCACWGIMTMLVGYLICHPLAYNWDPQGTEGSCGNIVAAWTSIGALDVIFDAAIFILPFPMLAKLKMRSGRKMAVSSVFILAAVTIIIGIVRTIMVNQADVTDFTYTGYYTFVWTGIEPPIAIMVACLMTMRPLFLVYWPRIREAFGLSACGEADDSELESYYPDNGPATRRFRHQSYGTRTSQHPAAQEITESRHGETFLEMNDAHSEDGTATQVGSMTELSTPSTPAKTKVKNKTMSQEVNELARSESIPEEEIFSMGATPALEPAYEGRSRRH